MAENNLLYKEDLKKLPLKGYKEIQHEGIKCVIYRHSYGWLNGYVQLPKKPKKSEQELEFYEKFQVHGGITFAGILNFLNSDDFFIGFDTGHAGDYNPNLGSIGYEIYRDYDYVVSEVKKLAEQVKKEY